MLFTIVYKLIYFRILNFPNIYIILNKPYGSIPIREIII